MEENNIKAIKQILERMTEAIDSLSLAEMLRVMGYIEGIKARRDIGGEVYALQTITSQHSNG